MKSDFLFELINDKSGDTAMRGGLGAMMILDALQLLKCHLLAFDYLFPSPNR